MESSRRTILKILVGLIGGAGVSKAGAANAISPKVDAMYRKIAETKNSFFSLEDVPGSYNAATYTWTPGRGSDGRITNASFALVPVGPWVAVVGTGFVSNIQPLLNAALPGYNDPGTGDLKMVIDAYSGIALDAVGGRLFAHGGGHHDSANNGVYRLDLAKMAWAIAKLPDMQTHWASNYSTRGTISFTVYPPAQAYANANPTTTDVYSDEFYDPGNPLANTGNPTARHTYEGMTFYGGKLRHSVRRYWEWDEATGLWSKKFPFNKTAGTHQTTGGGYMGESMKSTYDEVTNRFISTPTFTTAPAGGWAYNAVTRAWTQPAGLLGGYPAYQSGFARRGREWCSFAAPRVGDATFWPPTLRSWNLDTGAVTSTTLTGMVHNQCVGSRYYGETTSMCYVEATGKFAALFPYDKDSAFSVDAAIPLVIGMIDTTTATIEIETQTGAWPALNSWNGGVKNRFNYIRQMKCLILIPDGTKNTLIRRFV